MLVENADEPYADAIAGAIWKRRKSGYSIDTTRQLAETVESALAFLPQKGAERRGFEKPASAPSKRRALTSTVSLRCCTSF